MHTAQDTRYKRIFTAGLTEVEGKSRNRKDSARLTKQILRLSNQIYFDAHCECGKREFYKMNQPANNLLCFDDQISCFTLSPYDWSHNLCAIGQPSKIILGVLKLPVKYK